MGTFEVKATFLSEWEACSGVGKNEIIVFETEGKRTGKISFKDEPDIG